MEEKFYNPQQNHNSKMTVKLPYYCLFNREIALIQLIKKQMRSAKISKKINLLYYFRPQPCHV